MMILPYPLYGLRDDGPERRLSCRLPCTRDERRGRRNGRGDLLLEKRPRVHEEPLEVHVIVRVSRHRRLLVGLGTATQVDDVEIRWPNRAATTQRFGPLQADRSYKLVEGAAAAVPAHCPPIKMKNTN